MKERSITEITQGRLIWSYSLPHKYSMGFSVVVFSQISKKEAFFLFIIIKGRINFHHIIIKGRIWFSAHIIIDEMWTANLSHVKGNFSLKHVSTSEWNVEEQGPKR